MISKAADSLTWFNITDRTLRISRDWGFSHCRWKHINSFKSSSWPLISTFLCCVLQPVLSCSIPAYNCQMSIATSVTVLQAILSVHPFPAPMERHVLMYWMAGGVGVLQAILITSVRQNYMSLHPFPALIKAHVIIWWMVTGLTVLQVLLAMSVRQI